MQKFFSENKKDIFIVLAITFLALVLRLIALKNFGEFWIDEMFSEYFATKSSVFEVVRSLFSEDLHVPFYFVLLHFWTKLFGNNPSVMRLMGLFVSVLTVPASFYIVKDLFKNRLSAVVVASFLSISAFNIHYSVELRFYGMSIFFGLLATYFFVKFMQNFDKKSATLYIIFALLLLYTYNFSFMYVFCQFFVGFVYLLLKNKQKLINFCFVYFVIFIFYLPVLIMILHSAITYQTTILKFVRDVFYFDITWFLTFFITIFSNFYQQFITNVPLLNMNYLANFFYWKMFFFVFLPMFLGIVGMVLGVRNLNLKNQKMFLFFVPSIVLLFIQIILVFNHSLALIYRYTIITTTLLLILSVLGFTEEKRFKNLNIAIITIWLLLNFFSYFILTERFPVLNRQIKYTINLKESADKLNIQENDMVLIPSNGKLLKKDICNGNHFDINLYDSFYIGIRPNDINFVFGDELANLLNRKSAKSLLYKYIVLDKPLVELKKNMQREIFSKMKSGQRFILISDEELKNLKQNQAFLSQGIEYYQRSAIGNTLMAKIISDMIDFSKQDLKFVEYIEPSNMFYIYVFEKE